MMQFEFGQLVTLKDENIAIGTMAEGKMIDKNVVFRIIEIANSSFKGKHWVYISNRESSYTLDPMAHQVASDFSEDMVAFIVVTYRPLTKKIAEIEKNFKGPNYLFIVCESLCEATQKARNILAQFQTSITFPLLEEDNK